jgi:hypothetical protein
MSINAMNSILIGLLVFSILLNIVMFLGLIELYKVTVDTNQRSRTVETRTKVTDADTTEGWEWETGVDYPGKDPKQTITNHVKDEQYYDSQAYTVESALRGKS